MNPDGNQIRAGPFSMPVEFARWLISQAALFVVVLLILYILQQDITAVIAGEQTILNEEARINGTDQQMIANQELLLRYCNLQPVKGSGS